MKVPVSPSPPAWAGLLSRRDVLRVGSITLAATAFPSLLRARVAREGRARSVILLWMAGGVTHIDSFDPKPDAPAEVRGTLGAIDTRIPGIRFCETMPRLAEQVGHLAVVRSYSHDSNDHFLSQAYALSGRKVPMSQILTEPNVGSIVSHLMGPRDGFPGYIAIPGTTRPGPPPTNLFTGGWLGREYAPFSTGGQPRNDDFTAGVREASEDVFTKQALDLAPGIDGARLSSRRSLSERLEGTLRQMKTSAAEEVMGKQLGSALDMLLSPSVRRAFELRSEPATVRERYGQTKIGQRCLLARRLVEAGARFVMVDYGYDPEYGNLWDNHRAPVQKQPHICEMVKLPYHLAGTDRACAALVADLAVRGLLDQTLVVFLTEFGRTPKINKEGGRDHWGAAGSIFFAGAGVRGGQVIGSTDGHAAQVRGRGHTPGDVAATIYDALGISTETLLYDRQHRPLPVLPEGQVIPGVF